MAPYLEMLVWVTTISVPNFKLVSKSAQFTSNFELCSRTFKRALGPSEKKTASLKEKSQVRNGHMGGTLIELYLRETVVTDAALNSINPLPIIDELDAEPTIEELDKAINAISNQKAPGSDGIPPEVINSGKSALLEHELLCLCWREGAVPQDMRDATINTLYDNLRSGFFLGFFVSLAPEGKKITPDTFI